MTNATETTDEEVTFESAIEGARLYKRDNARITKALFFTTKRNKAKMA